MSAFRIASFACIALWLVLLISSLAGWINVKEVFGVGRHWITLPLLAGYFIFSYLGKKTSSPDDPKGSAPAPIDKSSNNSEN